MNLSIQEGFVPKALDVGPRKDRKIIFQVSIHHHGNYIDVSINRTNPEEKSHVCVCVVGVEGRMSTKSCSALSIRRT